MKLVGRAKNVGYWPAGVTRRLIATSSALMFCAQASGCIVIGAAVGSAHPRYGRPQAPAAIPAGTEVLVEGVDARGREGELEGKTRTPARPDMLCVTLEDERAARCIPLSKVHSVRPRVGDHGALGLFVGLGIDLVAAGLIALVLIDLQSGFGGPAW